LSLDALVDRFWQAGGIWAVICFLLSIVIVYMYKAREKSQNEHVETLKSVLPLMEKFESTMKTALSVVSKSRSDR
jgi:predicted negative regulator of RcsB-dependent stress response